MNAIAQRLANAVSGRVNNWALRRQGFDSSPLTLTSRRIYILPTRPGLIFGTIVFTMLMGSMNYNNNMAFALTFLLAAIGIISIHHCHGNIANLQLQLAGSQPDFVRGTVHFTLIAENISALPKSQFSVHWDGKQQTCDGLEPGERTRIDITLPAQERGWASLPRLKLSTRYPLGLLQAWSWIHLQAHEVVYPQPAPTANAATSHNDGTLSSNHSSPGDDDFAGLRDYQLGDPPKHIAWKALARTGEMLLTEYESGSDDLIWINWNDYPAANIEQRLSLMTRRLLDIEQSGHAWGLRLPDREIPPAIGSGHRDQCLKALALFDKPDSPEASS